jgi:hypothetical protein
MTAQPATPASLPPEGLPLITWRAELDDGSLVEDAPGAYLRIPRERLRALSIVLFTEQGVSTMARIQCPRAVYRRRTMIDGIGRRTIRFLVGCGCCNGGVLFTVGPEGSIPGPWTDVELFPEEAAAGVPPAPVAPVQLPATLMAMGPAPAPPVVVDAQGVPVAPAPAEAPAPLAEGDPGWEPIPVPPPGGATPDPGAPGPAAPPGPVYEDRGELEAADRAEDEPIRPGQLDPESLPEGSDPTVARGVPGSGPPPIADEEAPL